LGFRDAGAQALPEFRKNERRFAESGDALAASPRRIAAIAPLRLARRLNYLPDSEALMKISAIIQQCATIERMISEIYRSFAVRWGSGPIHEFWAHLADDEFAHGILLDSIASLPPADRDTPSITEAKIAGIRESVERCFPYGDLSLDGAFAIALELEDIELDNIYRRLLAMTASDHRMANACKSAMGQVDRHEEKLLDMIEKASDDPIVRKRAAERRRRVSGITV
jgi:hypothetical protein